MKKLTLGAAAAALLSVGAVQAAEAERYIVVVKANKNLDRVAARVEAKGGTVLQSLDQVNVLVVEGDARFAKKAGRMDAVRAIGMEPEFGEPDRGNIDAWRGNIDAWRGNIDAFRGNIDAFWGDLEGFRGNIDAFWGDLEGFQTDPELMRGNIDAWRGNIDAFWGDLDPFRGNIDAFRGNIDAWRGNIDAFAGPVDQDLLLGPLNLHWGIERVKAPEAWLAGHMGEGVTVAVIDSGVAWNHPDLRDRVVYATCISGDGTACNPYPTSSDHGTHVAGTVAASFGGGMATGVAPQAMIASYNVFPGAETSSSFGQFGAAILDAADRGYDVANLSLGGSTYRGKDTPSLKAYLMAHRRVMRYADDAGMLVVASAGNDAVSNNGPRITFPADVERVVTVAASGIRGSFRMVDEPTDAAAFYTTYGAQIDVAGPGGDCGTDAGYESCATTDLGYLGLFHAVVSTSVELAGEEGAVPECAATYSCPTGYSWSVGTSMAAPHVSGVAALVRGADPALPPRDVRQLLKRTADSAVSRQILGRGIVDAEAATKALD